jgi:hypothetical protein
LEKVLPAGPPPGEKPRPKRRARKTRQSYVEKLRDIFISSTLLTNKMDKDGQGVVLRVAFGIKSSGEKKMG